MRGPQPNGPKWKTENSMLIGYWYRFRVPPHFIHRLYLVYMTSGAAVARTRATNKTPQQYNSVVSVCVGRLYGSDEIEGKCDWMECNGLCWSAHKAKCIHTPTPIISLNTIAAIWPCVTWNIVQIRQRYAWALNESVTASFEMLWNIVNVVVLCAVAPPSPPPSPPSTTAAYRKQWKFFVLHIIWLATCCFTYVYAVVGWLLLVLRRLGNNFTTFHLNEIYKVYYTYNFNVYTHIMGIEYICGLTHTRSRLVRRGRA